MKKLTVLILLIFTALAVASMWNDSAIVDEGPHLPAGYSYLTQKEYRLNPEHPPLMKDLAAIPLLFMHVNFPSQIKAWTDDINGQWDFGHYFYYSAGNDAQNMLRAGRLPIILVGVLLGFFIFKFAAELWGENIGLLALFFYAFSPTILAHTRFITTDIGAAAGFLIGFYYFYRWLKEPNRKNMWVFGLVYGLCMLTKFSTILMPPIFILLAVIWYLINRHEKDSLKKYIGGVVFASVIAFFGIGIVYIYHVWNYDPARQLRDMTYILTSFGFKPAVNLVLWLTNGGFILFRAWAQYLLGVIMVYQRQVGGNTAYYLGTITNVASASYFPVMYLVKEPFAYILLELFGVYLALKKHYELRHRAGGRRITFKEFVDLIKNNFAETSSIIIIVIYWVVSLHANLNIGIRHIVPTLPFVYLLTARQIGYWIKTTTERISNYQGFWQILGLWWRRFKRITTVLILLLWASFSVVFTFPSFLSYFNELGGGPNIGYKIATDSNLDWGQDLLRLSQFINQNGIQSIGVDYFGGGDVNYYLGSVAHIFNSETPQKGWIAVSATFYQGGCHHEFVGRCNYDQRAYSWLDKYQPVVKIGYSIFVYHIE